MDATLGAHGRWDRHPNHWNFPAQCPPGPPLPPLRTANTEKARSQRTRPEHGGGPRLQREQVQNPEPRRRVVGSPATRETQTRGQHSVPLGGGTVTLTCRAPVTVQAVGTRTATLTATLSFLESRESETTQVAGQQPQSVGTGSRSQSGTRRRRAHQRVTAPSTDKHSPGGPGKQDLQTTHGIWLA